MIICSSYKKALNKINNHLNLDQHSVEMKWHTIPLDLIACTIMHSRYPANARNDRAVILK